MPQPLLAQVEAQLDQLIRRYKQLQVEYSTLHDRENQWLEERARLLEKNQLACARIDAMVERLKKLEADSE